MIKNKSLKLLVKIMTMSYLTPKLFKLMMFFYFIRKKHNYKKPCMHDIELKVQGKALISHNFHCLSVAIKKKTSLHSSLLSHEHLNWQEVTLSCEKVVVSSDEQVFRLANDTSSESETGTDTCVKCFLISQSDSIMTIKCFLWVPRIWK